MSVEDEGTFSIYAFHSEEEPPQTDERRDGVPRWRLAEAVGWALDRGHDTMLVQRTNDRPSSTPLLTHHVCTDPKCPGGCS